MNKLKYIDELEGIKFYCFTPSLFKIYYPCYKKEECPTYFKRPIHILRMIREIYKSNYKVVYMFENEKVIGHLVVGRGGSRIAESTKNDIVIGPIWVVPNKRCNGYASLGIRFILEKMNLDYQYAYEYIERTNIASIRTVEKNGFDFVSECKEFGVFKVIKPYANGNLNVYRIKKTEE